jgi:hypothetical protein
MIHYVVALYLGQRRHNLHDPITYLKAHLDFLKDSGPEIVSATIVLNYDDDSQIARAIEWIDHYDMPHVNLHARPNVGYSYAAWETAVKEYRGPKVEYHFLCEDDYIPGYADFHKPFINKFSPKVGYVCSIVSGEGPDRHAGMSIGFLKHTAGRDALFNFGEIFNINFGQGYHDAEWTQRKFLDYIEYLGYEFVDCADESSFPFMAFGEVVYYGNKDKPAAIVPVGVDLD